MIGPFLRHHSVVAGSASSLAGWGLLYRMPLQGTRAGRRILVSPSITDIPYSCDQKPEERKKSGIRASKHTCDPLRLWPIHAGSLLNHQDRHPPEYVRYAQSRSFFHLAFNLSKTAGILSFSDPSCIVPLRTAANYGPKPTPARPCPSATARPDTTAGQ